jgi:D-3-phosphoglycerate dehydrogenase
MTRRIPWAFDSVKLGVWNRRLFPGKVMLSSMSLGIIGLGRLGGMVARYGQCFGMKVEYYDPYVASPPFADVQRLASLIDLVAQNDVVSLHAPHNDETHNMLDREVFLNFKKGSYFINTARAEIVDFDALFEALVSERLAGAAMDVIEGEFQRGFSGSRAFYEHKLLEYARTHDNLLITPHIGGSTTDAWEKTEQYTIRKILDLFH